MLAWAGSRADRSSAWRWGALWSAIPNYCFWTSRPRGWTRRLAARLWDLIEQFKAAGRTIILTTHYMDEAERLSDRVAVMDHGKIIALGTPRELIASIGVEHIVEFSAAGALDDGALKRD